MFVSLDGSSYDGESTGSVSITVLTGRGSLGFLQMCGKYLCRGFGELTSRARNVSACHHNKPTAEKRRSDQTFVRIWIAASRHCLRGSGTRHGCAISTRSPARALKVGYRGDDSYGGQWPLPDNTPDIGKESRRFFGDFRPECCLIRIDPDLFRLVRVSTADGMLAVVVDTRSEAGNVFPIPCRVRPLRCVLAALPALASRIPRVATCLRSLA